MFFLNKSELLGNIPSIWTLQGEPIEQVSIYKGLGFLIDHELSFRNHTVRLVTKLMVKIVFYYRHKFCFSLRAWKYSVSAAFLPLLNYSDILSMSSSAKCLHSLNSVYHCALKFVTGCSHLLHHCELYAKTGCSIHLFVPHVSTELGKKFSQWNAFQSDQTLTEVISLGAFCSILFQSQGMSLEQYPCFRSCLSLSNICTKSPI